MHARYFPNFSGFLNININIVHNVADILDPSAQLVQPTLHGVDGDAGSHLVPQAQPVQPALHGHHAQLFLGCHQVFVEHRFLTPASSGRTRTVP